MMRLSKPAATAEGGCATFILCWLAVASTVSADPIIPGDPDFSVQWALQNTGQTLHGRTGLPGADVAAPDAWAIHGGGSPVVVAVVGAGVDDHAQYADRLLEGHVTPSAGGDPYSTLDTLGQGTRLAGLIAAKMDDIGIAGLNPHVHILPVRVVAGPFATQDAVAEGITWAAGHGAEIILVPAQFSTGSDALAAAVENAAAAGSLVVATAGDQEDPSIAFPAAYPECLAVSATAIDDTLAVFSHFGPEVDIAAPSQSIWSTALLGQYAFEQQPDGGFAAAYVAAAASLIWSYAPQLTNGQVRQILLDSADDLGEPGWDSRFGHGRLNVAGAFAMTQPPLLRFELLDGLPDVLVANTMHTVELRIADGAQTVVPETAALIYRTLPGGVAPPIPLRWLGEDMYAADFPPLPCGVVIEYYLAASTTDNFTVFEPRHAPIAVRSAAVASLPSIVPVFADDFEIDQLWQTQVEGGAIAAGWTRVEPGGILDGGVYSQPEYDRSPDHGRFCFVTGQHSGSPTQNIGADDVDGGPVRLVSPLIAIASRDAEIRYAAWVYSRSGVLDSLDVELDAGSGWLAIESISNTAGWSDRSFRLSDYGVVGPVQVQVRFSIADPQLDSLTEAGIDEFAVRATGCEALGDADGDGDTDAADWLAFSSCLAGPSAAIPTGCASLDINGDDRIDIADAAVFTRAFLP